MTKWFSNSPEVTAFESNVKSIHMPDSESTKAVGISWLPSENAFKLKMDTYVMGLRATKRNILLLTSKLFEKKDPIAGTLATYDWDEPIPMHFKIAWNMQNKHSVSAG